MKKIFVIAIMLYASIECMDQSNRRTRHAAASGSGGPIRRSDQTSNREEPYRMPYHLRNRTRSQHVVSPPSQVEQNNEESDEMQEGMSSFLQQIFDTPAFQEYINGIAQEIAEEISQEERTTVMTSDQRKIELIKVIQEKFCHIQQLKDKEGTTGNLKRLSFVQILNKYKKLQQEKVRTLEYLNLYQKNIKELTEMYQELIKEHQLLEHLQNNPQQINQNTCCICCDDNTELMHIPCQQEHTERICTICYGKILSTHNDELFPDQLEKATYNNCPLCRTEFNT